MIQHDSKYSWFRLSVTLAIATIGNVGMWLIIVVMPAIQSEFHIDRAEAALPYTLTMIGFAFGNFIIGGFVDRYGIVRVLIAAAVLNAIGLAGAASASSIAVISGFQFLIGLGNAATFGPLIADVSHWFLKRRGIAVALAASGNYFSGALWPWVLKDVIELQGWRSTYVVLAGLSLAIMMPLALWLKAKLNAESSAHADHISCERLAMTTMSSNRVTALLGIAGIACCVAMSMPQVHIVAYCVDLGFGAVVGAEMLSLMLLGGVVSRVISGVLADRLGGVKTLLIGSVLQCLGLIFYLPSNSMMSLYAVSLMFGLAQGGIVPSYALIVREYLPGHEAGSRVGFVLMTTILGMALGGWMSGWIYVKTGSYELAFINGIVWNLLNMAIAGFFLWWSKPSRPAPILPIG